jgi:hypothetical protein
VSRQEIPYGLDRLVFLWAASMARRHGSAFRFHPRDLSEIFGIRCPREETLERLLRISQTCIEIHRSADDHHLIGMRVAVELLEIRGDEATMQLGSQFTPESLIPVSRDVIAGCVQQKSMAALDLYLWQMRASHGSTSRIEVPVFGQGGLYEHLAGVTRTVVGGGKARQQLRRRQALIKELWPACPHFLSEDGNTFVLEPMEAP